MITTINNKHNKLNVPNSTDKGNVIRNVPHLRFPEFEGEWEKCKLGELTTKVGSGSTPKGGNAVYTSVGHCFVRSQNVGMGYLILDDIAHIDDDIHQKHKATELNEYDVLLNITGASIGRTAIATKEIEGGNVNQHVCIIRANSKVSPKFLCNYIQTKKIQNYIQSLQTGGSREGLNFEQIRSFPISLPNIAEQNKIAQLLDKLNERISTQSKIIDKLQTLIKGMEDNLLDNPLWEKTYLRSFMQFFPTNSLSWEQLSYKEGAIRNLHYGLIHGLQTRGINSVSLPMIKNEAIPKQYTLCQVGDVAFADASEDTGEIAKSVEFVDTIEGDTICGLHTIHGRDIKNRTVVGFKGFAFNSRYFHNQIKRLAQGTKVFSITANNLSSCYVYLPDLETQKAIVNLLKTYEAKLLVSKRLLEHYEKQKQYLLRQMFI